MRTDHRCGQIHRVSEIEDLTRIFAVANKPIIVGGGSNILFTQDTDRDLVVIDISGKEVSSETSSQVNLHIGAGEDWHDLVMWAINHDFGGIENLSLIPGKCGAAPMQNIGAYGVEIKDVLSYVDVYNIKTGELIRMSNEECEFSYRESIFKTILKDKVVITAIGITLTKPGHHTYNTSYGAIEKELEKSTQPIGLRSISKAVISIRQSKLPDPKILPNNGSFFKNPIIPKEAYDRALSVHPDMPSYPVNKTHVKVPAGWLIDKAGWKGRKVGRVGVHDRQALVLVNLDQALGDEIIKLAENIAADVDKKYGINISPEVNLY